MKRISRAFISSTTSGTPRRTVSWVRDSAPRTPGKPTKGRRPSYRSAKVSRGHPALGAIGFAASERVQIPVLERVSRLVASGRLRSGEAIGERVGNLLAEPSASQWYAWSVDGDGAFTFAMDETREAKQAALDGRFFLQTDDAGMALSEVVDAYYTMQKVEHASQR
jgi:hypothetical protein